MQKANDSLRQPAIQGASREESSGMFLYEKVKLQLESYKLNIQYKAKTWDELIRLVEAPFQSEDCKDWQRAEFARILADLQIKLNNFEKAQEYFEKSIAHNNQDARTWTAYARFHQNIYEVRKNELSLTTAVKSFVTATALALHKSKILIPNLLNLFKQSALDPNTRIESIIHYLKENLPKMPVWIWLFWLPQIIG